MQKNNFIHINKRISEVKKCIKRKNFEGFMQSKSDSYLGEHVSKDSERLEWLTGFSGSAGEVLIIHNKVLLFVDGRYFLQAKYETRKTGIKILLSNENTLIDWLKENIKDNSLIAFDPWLYSVEKVSKIIKISKNEKFNFKPINKNPIDLLWKDRPPKSLSLLVSHPVRYSGITSKNKIKELCNKMNLNKVDAFLVCQPDSLAWILNIRGRDLENTPIILARAIIMSNGNIFLFINKNKIEQKGLSHLKKCAKSVKIYEENSIFHVIKKLTTNNKRIWIDPLSTPYVIIANKIFKSSSFVIKPCPIELSKAIKNKTEINGSIEAHRKDGIALCNFLYWLSNSTQKMTEISTSQKIDSLRSKQNNFICKSFETISGFSANGAIVHYKVNENTNINFKKNNLYLFDSGGQYLEGTTDVTRTVVIGKPSNEMVKYFTIVLRAHISLATIIFPYGTTGHELDIITRKVLWKEGIDYGHGTGHGVGSCLSVHEGPQRISKGSNTALEPGMIVSNEPGFYLKDKFGIRIENLMLVQSYQKNKFNNKSMLSFRSLTLVPIDKKLINYKELNTEEINWLNDYHLFVYNTIGPNLSKGKRSWLKNVCKKVS